MEDKGMTGKERGEVEKSDGREYLTIFNTSRSFEDARCLSLSQCDN